MIRRLSSILAALLLVGAAGPGAAQATSPEPVGAALAQLQFEDARLQTVGWRLATGNAPFCADTRPAIGLLLQDVMNYDEPARLRAAVGITGDIAVEAVAEGAPAALAGLRPNAEVLAIAGEPVTEFPAAAAGDYRRLKLLHDRIDAELARAGRVSLTIAGRDEPVEIAGLTVCPGRFELLTQGGKAQADGDRVLIGRSFGVSRDPAANIDQDEFAAAVAHEYAHNLLGHRAWLAKAGRDWRNIRRTEREADRLAVWLLANAGFQPEAAVRLMRGWGRRRDPGLLRAPTHQGWDERAALMEAELEPMRASLRRRGMADWSRDFERE